MAAGSVGGLVVLVGELNVLQPDAAAWVLRAAVELDGDLRGGRPVDVLVGDVADSDPRRLARAALVVGAVVLVDDDGVLDVDHEGVLEKDAPGEAAAGPPPRLDPQPVLGARERRRFHRHVLHPGLVLLLPKASNAASLQCVLGKYLCMTFFF